MKKIFFLLFLLMCQLSISQNWLDQKCEVDARLFPEDIDKASERNFLDVIINQEGKIMVNNKDLSILNEAKFKEYIYFFIENPNEDDQLAKSPKKAMISLKHYNHPEQFEAIEQQIREVYYFLWNNYAQEKYEDDYINLTCKERSKVQKEYPYNLYLPKKTKEKEKGKPNFAGPPPFEGDVKDN
ncbi:MAG: hypothetical protein LAT51_10165 [Flavobacteriaceae bacterium]|nr:hypothetical protein [Flavobacteriaceae bacterium]